jgi:hypothetical protein
MTFGRVDLYSCDDQNQFTFLLRYDLEILLYARASLIQFTLFKIAASPKGNR